MRSLSLRIFLSFWLALLTIVAAAIGITVLILTTTDLQPHERNASLNAAALALSRDGREGLVSWLSAQQSNDKRPPIVIFDEAGEELLGRTFGRRARGWQPREPLEIGDVRIVAPQPLPVLISRDGARYRIAISPPRPDRFGFRALRDARTPVVLIALAVTALVSWLLARSITRPIDDLTSAAQQLAGGRLDSLPAPQTLARRDEVGRLARNFAAMGTRIRELLASHERLLRDVSHELRSPLSRMRLALGLARQDGATVDQQLGRLERDAERLDSLIGQILSVTRLGAGDAVLRYSQTDMAAMIAGIAQDAEFEARASGKSVRLVSTTENLTMSVDPTWMASAIENVVRNAVRHTAPATEISVSVEVGTENLTIRVRDHGPGVPEEELRRIFEPFHRVIAARDRDSGGEGLGLAITARVIAAHGGVAAASNAPEGGLIVTLTLPRR